MSPFLTVKTHQEWYQETLLGQPEISKNCSHALTYRRQVVWRRWQLDLRTGERLEDQPAPQMSLAMQGQMGALAHALGPRPPIFTGLNQVSCLTG